MLAAAACRRSPEHFMNPRSLVPACLAAGSMALAAIAPARGDVLPRTPSAAAVELYFISPVDGATVPKRFDVRFGLRGMGVAPAGVDLPDTGHHHLLIDVEDIDYSRPLPADEQHLHFGKGQTETVLELPPGRHTLQLVLGDHRHVPHDPPVVSTRITITVE
jgi:hypothetical protein